MRYLSGDILKLIAEETYSESYKAHKIELDLETDTASRLDIREPRLDNPKLGETVKYRGYRSLAKAVQDMSQSYSQIFTYFLDGSRHVYKIDDMAYQHSNERKMVYPIVAGQVVVGCCRRSNKKMFAEKFIGEVVIALPDIANYNSKTGFLPALTKKINDKLSGRKFKLEISKILDYKTGQQQDMAFEDRAVATIQDYMYQTEQNIFASLVEQGKLNQTNYLVKDGSLEYRILDDFKRDKRKFLTFKNNYGYVIGVSKKFNPALWTTGSGANSKPNPGFIAGLRLYERTPVICFENPDFHGDIKFAVWYVRIRLRHTDSPFDGVVKVEKMLVTKEELNSEKIDRDLVDTLSAHLINERNPVYYGSDNRWANHIYPIFLTETFVKSKCISTEIFLHLF